MPDERTRYKAARMLAVPTSRLCAHFAGLVMEAKVHKGRLIWRIAEGEFNELSPSVFSNWFYVNRCGGYRMNG